VCVCALQAGVQQQARKNGGTGGGGMGTAFLGGSRGGVSFMGAGGHAMFGEAGVVLLGTAPPMGAIASCAAGGSACLCQVLGRVV